MKKIYLFLIALSISAISFAGSSFTLTLQVDVSAYIAAGNTINATGIHLAGNFATNGCVEITGDWDPANAGGGLVDMGSDIWGITLTFGASADSLQFKFINGNDWAVGAPNIEGQAGTTLITADCGFGDGFGGFNRLFVFDDGEPVDGYQFCWDMCTRCNGEDAEITGVFNMTPISSNISVYPNPATTNSVVSFNLINPGNVTFELYNVTGQMVKSFASNYNYAGLTEYNLDMNGLDNGIYNLIIRSNDAIATKSIVKN